MNENSNLIVVFYGELTTKGKNIRDFINLYGKNIRAALKNRATAAGAKSRLARLKQRCVSDSQPTRTRG